MSDAETLGQTARVALEKVRREIPRGTMQPGTVVQPQPAGPFGGARALVHIDGNPADQLNEVDVIDGRTYRPGARVMVEYVEPQGALIRSGVDCDDRTILLPFSADSEPAIGERSAPGRVDGDAVLTRIIIDTMFPPGGADIEIQVDQDTGSPLAVATLPAGDFTSSTDVDLPVAYSTGPLYVEMLDDAGGGWESITVTLVLTVACSIGEPFTF